MDTAHRTLWLFTIIITITTISCDPLRRRGSQQNPYGPPLHLFPTGPIGPPSSGSSPGRLPIHHGPSRPSTPPFKPLPYHPPKPMRFNKYPPSGHRPNSGPPYKKPHHYKGGPTFGNKYHPAPVQRPSPYPQYQEDDPPKHTIATFVDKPKPSNLGTPILRYTGVNKKPTISYGPPYPPKPFKAYGVPNYDEDDDERNHYHQQKYSTLQHDQQQKHQNYQQEQQKFQTFPQEQQNFQTFQHDQPQKYPNFQQEQQNFQSYQPQEQHKKYQNFQQEQQNFQSYQPQEQHKKYSNFHQDQQVEYNNDPIYSSVQSAATANLPNLNYQSTVQTKPTRRRRPIRPETQLGPSVLNEQPQNYDDFLRETFTERSESLQPQETRRRRPSGRFRAPSRASNHQYEVTTEAEERKSEDEAEWKPSHSSESDVEWQ